MRNPKVRLERRQLIRRGFNQSFMDENGNVMVMKVIAVVTQVMVLTNTTAYFVEMMGKPEVLLICLSFLIAPDVFKKALNIRYGGQTNGTTK